ncbi:hypothetical protein CFBP5875_21325 [Agrobacterium pusense]|uniref:hypothetical protein n=1 Tax=Hyphomicrobiales TaxID=356 RepID=UPI000512FA81|nr:MULTISPECIES: hypothetical protein [Hyphomicrobiales]ANV25995.1 hypothetical protein BA939_18640 [Rhizobium sp. S41]KGE82602.1 hypothetical protein LW14_11805 [Rhizobium sp. H41]TGR68206.1 hypothetical protein EN837_16330 [bacterium M00.F.Ca.ET.194.01.1.1]TGS54309.1 hypothetical protein EN822_16325 [bacterium M00.F.Ca.ET.179.01.1.1]TGV47125.1 hypothetical protein EN811_16330 [bacterium M00.F.Ca.ET.168.01.1.1]
MFEFLKPQQQPVIDDVEATGTYADALLNVTSPELTRSTAREHGHEAHSRDYCENRNISRSALGFA